MTERQVSAAEFRERTRDLTGIARVVNFYGMVEQVGSVYFENASHYFQAPAFSDLLIRDPTTLQVLPEGEPGLIQVLSALPQSYPGHSLLTEDIGVIRGHATGEDGAMAGRCFEVLGRAPRSEVRGCSDTLEVHEYV